MITSWQVSATKAKELVVGMYFEATQVVDDISGPPADGMYVKVRGSSQNYSTSWSAFSQLLVRPDLW